MDLFSFYADNQLVKKATSADDAPTPGYLYHEIVGKYYIIICNLFFFF